MALPTSGAIGFLTCLNERGLGAQAWSMSNIYSDTRPGYQAYNLNAMRVGLLWYTAQWSGNCANGNCNCNCNCGNIQCTNCSVCSAINCGSAEGRAYYNPNCNCACSYNCNITATNITYNCNCNCVCSTDGA